MKNETPVAEEGADALLEGGKVVGIGGVSVASDVAVLSRQIANLARLGSVGVAWSRLTTLIGVKVSQR